MSQAQTLGRVPLAGFYLPPKTAALMLMFQGGVALPAAFLLERRLGWGPMAKENPLNALSVQLELQADCLAGVWGHHANKKQLLDAGDVDEGLSAAAAIGDDRLTGGRVSPESFTHGTSEQRARWLRQGLQTGDINSCDTFRSNTY